MQLEVSVRVRVERKWVHLEETVCAVKPLGPKNIQPHIVTPTLAQLH